MSTLDKRNPIANAVRTALFATAAVSVFAAPTTFAAEEDEKADEQKVTITGSRIKRTDIETASPVQITSSEDIKLSGFTRIEDLMNSLPQVEAAQTSFISNGASGTASLDLRGLGATRTLVLVNGRRLQPGGVYSQSPDVNQIPAALVERVEVMTGGGSSTYGADAVAGVVNFVMKDDFEGVEINLGAAGYQHNNDNSYIQDLMDARGFDYPSGDSGIDGKNYNLDITMGASFDGGRGHATVYATWRKVEELRQAARDYSSCALNDAGTACGGSGNAIVPNFYIGSVTPGGDFDWDNYDYWTLDANGFIPSSGNIYNYAPVNHFMRPDIRQTLGAFVDYEINEHVRPYMEVSFMRDRTVAQIAESGTFFNDTYLIDYDSDLLSDAQRTQLTDAFGIVSGEQFATYIGKRNVEGGPRASSLDHEAFRIVFGSEGEIDENWSYDASFQYGSTSSSAAYLNDFFGPRIFTALSANGESCADTSGCIPYEVFTLNGVTEEAAGALTGTGILNGVATELIVNAYVTGETGLTIPSAEDPVAVVFGTEYREESFERLSDEVFAKGLLLGQGGETVSIAGSYDVTEIFGEASVPVYQGDSGDSLTVDLGYRYSDYNTSGGVNAYKVAVDYNPNEDWKIRASFNRAVRAPNVAELFSPQSKGLWNGTDPCSGTTPTQTAAQCANSGVTAAQYGNITASPASQYNGLFGGNPDLKPETADTVTFGVVGNPIENLNFSVDYWDIQMEDVIGSVGSQLTVEKCNETGNPALCSNIHRSAGGSLWLGSSSFVQGTNINLAARHWEGVDVSANYKMEVGDGELVFNFIGTQSLTKEYDPLPGDDSAKYDCTGLVNVNCFAQPKWRHSLNVSYTQGTFWTVSGKWRYYGDVDYDGGVDTLAADGIDAQSYFDVKGAFDVSQNVAVLIGVNNLLDEEPPMVGGTLSSNANTVAGYYDTLGRYIHASVTFKF